MESFSITSVIRPILSDKIDPKAQLFRSYHKTQRDWDHLTIITGIKGHVSGTVLNFGDSLYLGTVLHLRTVPILRDCSAFGDSSSFEDSPNFIGQFFRGKLGTVLHFYRREDRKTFQGRRIN